MSTDKFKSDRPDISFVPITKKLRDIGDGISLPAIKPHRRDHSGMKLVFVKRLAVVAQR